jgi:hypothetical protein
MMRQVQVSENTTPSNQVLPASQEDQAEQATTQADTQPKTYDEAYVKKLRDEAAAHRTKLREFERAEEERRQASLSEQEKAEARAKTAEERLSSIQVRADRAELKVAAQKAGIVDPDVAYRLLDESAIERNEDGEITNADALMTQLAKDKPYVKGQDAKPAPLVAAPTSKTNGATSDSHLPTYTREQIADRGFWEKNRDSIMKAIREGRVA